MNNEIILFILAALFVVIGIAGLALPVLPGALLILTGFVLAAWAESFTYIGPGTLTVLGVMTLLMYAVDFAASALGAKRFGASNRAIIGASLGALVGIFFGIPGVLLGPFCGAVIGELTAQRNLHAAGQAGIGATIGLALGVAAKFAIAFSMMGIFLVIRFF
ncbi:DUF456 family protein [Desulfococcaceae bacterium HSG9]|nr:DUF456 family protein [Desulfococcaceae bacterium HSG9]